MKITCITWRASVSLEKTSTTSSAYRYVKDLSPVQLKKFMDDELPPKNAKQLWETGETTYGGDGKIYKYKLEVK